MPDANSIAIVLVVTVACSLLAHLRRGIKRWALAHRLGRSLRLAVRREIRRKRDARRQAAGRGTGVPA
jgi:hypothetical protein